MVRIDWIRWLVGAGGVASGWSQTGAAGRPSGGTRLIGRRQAVPIVQGEITARSDPYRRQAASARLTPLVPSLDATH